MPENNEPSLLDTLSQETETKAQTTTTSVMWDFTNDPKDIKDDTVSPEASQNSSTTSSSETPAKEGKSPMSDAQKEKVRQASAETLTATLDATIDILGSLVINNRFKKRFTPDEFDKAQELQDKPKESISDEAELALYNKYNREKKKRDSKIKELPFEESDTTRLTTIFYNYFKITGKEMSPEFLLVVGIGSILVDKATIVFSD